jgi:hypothetical protein
VNVPRISVLCAVRERVLLLETMLDSLFRTAEAPEGVELVLRCDYDDEAMLSYLRGRAWRHRTIVGPRLDGYASLATFTNEMARLARANVLLVVNDDAVFETPGWDGLLLAGTSGFPDEIFLLGVDTIMNSGHFPFPCVSKRVVQTLGCLFDERLVYTDVWLRDVLAPFGRAVLLPSVTVRHAWNGMTEDQRRALGIVQADGYGALYTQCVEEGVERIRGVLCA